MELSVPVLNDWNERGESSLPGHLGLKILDVQPGKVTAELKIKPFLLAPNGFLHAGSIVTLADTCCGYGCIASLPDGANNFTTIELKSNHLGTVRDGTIGCIASISHSGRSTQVWDAAVTDQATGKTIAMFRCTQMILYPRPGSVG